MEFPIINKHPFWKDINNEHWNNWHWQQANRITKIEQIQNILKNNLTNNLTSQEINAFNKTSLNFMVAITPYYFSLIDFNDQKDPIRLQAIPQEGETLEHIDDVDDPLAEEHDMPVPGLTHRYPDRVLLYTTHNCPVYCRHCTRKRKVSNPNSAATLTQINLGLDYIRKHKEVRDVVISGGDPLSLSDERLFKIISDLQEIEHIDIMRLGTRNIVTLPQRIINEFALKLKELNSRKINGKRKIVFINTHFNNPKECTDEAEEAAHRLLMSGSPLGNQCVLLKGINDNINTMKKLNHKLLNFGIKPYYIYLCDPTPGTSHFRTSVEIGLEIIDNLRGHTSGFATPQLVIDAPGGGGKILIPNGIVARHVGKKYTIWKLINFEKKYYYYIAPNDETNYYKRYNKPIPPDFDLQELKNSHLKHLFKENKILDI